METATRIEIGIAVAHSSARAARAAQLPLLPLASGLIYMPRKQLTPVCPLGSRSAGSLLISPK